jgi:hypothetical protein
VPEVPPFLFASPGTFPSPYKYTVPGAGEVQPYTATASYINSSGQAIKPALRIKSSSGNLLALVFPADTIANGATAEVTFVPPFGSAAASSPSGGGIQFDTDPQAGDWLVVTTTGTEPITGIGVQFTDSGGGGVNFETTGFGTHGQGGVYIQGDDASGSGFPAALAVQMNETSNAAPIGITVDADATAGGGGTGNAVGLNANADGNAASGAVAVSAGAALFGTGSVGATGVVGSSDIQSTTASGDAVGVHTDAQTSGAGKAIGLDAVATNAFHATGDTIGARITAKQNAGGSGTLYGLQVFIGTTKVFQINADGSLHGLTGQSLTFDL